MADDKILDRVRKLLELASKNDNVAEATSAAARAQELMTRYAIGAEMLMTAGTVDEQIEADLLYAGARVATWRDQLALPLCAANQCKVYRSNGALHIIGRASDAATVRYLFIYVANEIERLCKFEADMRGNPGNVWCSNFKMGAALEVGQRVREAAQAAQAAMRREADAGDTLGTGSAIVLVNGALAKLDARKQAVEEFGRKKLNLRAGKRSQSKVDDNARTAGQRAGKHIDLTNPKNALGAGTRKSLQR